MITLTILFFLLASVSFALLNRRRSTAIAITATLIAFEAVGSGLIPSFLLEPLQSKSIVTDKPIWGERNVIIVLGDGTARLTSQSTVKPSILAYSRILEAIRLHVLAKKSDHQCTILVSGGDPSGTGVTEADDYQAAMVQLGVPGSGILLERPSLKTSKNAEISEEILV